MLKRTPMIARNAWAQVIWNVRLTMSDYPKAPGSRTYRLASWIIRAIY